MTKAKQASVREQLDRLIIECQDEDGSIPIHEQKGMRDDILALIDEVVETVLDVQFKHEVLHSPAELKAVATIKEAQRARKSALLG